MVERMKYWRWTLSVLALVGLAISLLSPSAGATSYRVLVTVDDEPITDYDVDQRIKLREALGYRPETGDQRKKALDSLIDDVVVRSEAKRNKVDITDKQLDELIEKLAKGANTTVDGLREKLKDKGVSIGALKRHVTSTIVMRWLMNKDGQKKTTADPAEIDQRFNNIVNDPRFKPVQLYEVIQIDLPVEQSSGAMREQLIYARAIEGRQIAERYKGCATLRQATDGVFNVKTSKPIQALGEKMPPEMRKALDQAGTKRLIGPMPSQDGVRLIAYCGKKMMNPPKPTREMVENMVLNERYSASISPPSGNCAASRLSITRTPRCSRSNYRGALAMSALPLALTMGEPAGIAPEITVAAWLALAATGPVFVLIGDAPLLRERARALGLDIAVTEIGDVAAAAATFRTSLPVLPCPLASPAPAPDIPIPARPAR